MDYFISLVDSVKGDIYVCNEDYQIEYANKSFRKRYGINCVNKQCYKVIYKLESPCSWCLHKKANCDKKKMMQEVFNTQDYRWQQVIYSPLMNQNASMIILNDITDRKNLEKEVIAQRQKLQEYSDQIQTIYDGLTDGLVIVNSKKNKIVNANLAFCTMFRYTKKELLNLGIEDLHPHDSLERVLKEFHEKLAGKRFVSTDVPCLKKDGTVFYADIVDSQIIYNNQHCIIGFFRDTTGRKNSEENRKSFISTLANDLRGPLLAENLVLKYLIKGTYGTLTDKEFTVAQNILSSNNELLTLVNVLMDVYQYETAGIELSKDDVNLQELVKECISDIATSQEVHKSNIKCNIPSTFVRIHADKIQLKRVFINLIVNILCHVSEKCVINIEAEGNNNFITVKIINNEVKLPEKDLENVFEIYYTSANKFQKAGHGLGLYYSRQIINAHKGVFWVETSEDKKSAFCFTLPVGQCNH